MRFSILLIILPLILLLSSCKSNYLEIQIKQGEISIEEYDPDNLILPLRGEWKYYPQQFITEERTAATQYLSSSERPQELDRWGTLEADIVLLDFEGDLTLQLKENLFSYRIYANDKLVLQSGLPGENRQESYPGKTVIMRPFHVDSGTINLVIEYSNFYQKDLRFPSITLGNWERLHSMDLKRLYRDLVFSGAFLAIGLLYTILFLKSPRDFSSLWFGMICLSTMLRVLLTETSLLERITPANWTIFLERLEYVGMSGMVIFFYLFSIHLFQRFRLQPFHWAVLTPSLVFTVICLTTPIYIFSYLLQTYQLIVVLTGGLTILNLFRAWRKGRESAGFLLILMLLVLSAALMDILFYNHFSRSGTFTGIAVFLVVVLQGTLLINRVSYTQKRITALSRNFRKVNMELLSNQQRLEDQNQRLNQLALIDQLTQVPNRVQMLDILGDKLELARRQRNLLCIFYIDIDNFKLINDVMGHSTGDNTLYLFAQNLKRMIRKSDSLFRVTSDEFIILVESLKTREQVRIFAEKLISSFPGEFPIEDNDVHLTISMGVAYWGKGQVEETIQSLIRKADLAVTKAKNIGKNCFVFYSEEMDRELTFRINMEERMGLALKEQQFELHYQPQINIQTGILHGFEALIRWNDPQEGMIAPGQFIPLAEQNGMIMELGEWILNEGCSQLRAWLDRGYRDFTLAINLSGLQFEHPDLVPMIKEMIKRWKIPPGYLVLELTESSLLMDWRLISEKMSQLKELGLLIAIDDFGTGYSNLGYLSSFPLDVLKIDRVFIRKIRKNNKDRRLVIAIINIAHSLNLELVAEGVEEEEDRDLLYSQGCYCVQGFLYSKALPPEIAEAFFGRTLRH